MVLQQHKILAVDDSPVNLSLIRKLLVDDYDVRTAAQGEVGLREALHWRPDIVLLDIMMPGIDGYEICRKLRAQASLSHTKIIMVSAKGMLEERLAAYQVGADDYIVKPFDVDEFLAKIKVYARLTTAEETAGLKGRLLKLLSHKVRSPLNSMVTPAEMLTHDYASMDEEERHMLADLIERNVRRLQLLVEKVTTLSEVSDHAWQIDLEPANLCHLIRTATTDATPLAKEKNVTFKTTLPESVIVSLNEQFLALAIKEVLENAIKFSGLDGQIEVTCSADSEFAHISVRDWGPGISADFLPRMFDEFTIDHAARLRSESIKESSGIGLAIARQIIWAHGGKIHAESDFGHGACVMIDIPVASTVSGASANLVSSDMSGSLGCCKL